VEGVIRQAFSYIFDPEREGLPVGLLPKLEFRNIDESPFHLLGEKITPIPLIHNNFNVFGFRVGDVAYCTDVSEIPARSWPLLEGLKVFIVDALRPGKPHPAHFSLDQALDVVARLKPEQTYLTHMAHTMDYDTLIRTLPPGVEPAYDGLSFRF
jgi:phosphoribosyl 1,2-cyclic phosphate phosphodiesterase